MKKKIEPLPCPFCGVVPTDIRDRWDDGPNCICSTHKCPASGCYATIEIWNKRAYQPQLYVIEQQFKDSLKVVIDERDECLNLLREKVNESLAAFGNYNGVMEEYSRRGNSKSGEFFTKMYDLVKKYEKG